MKKNALGLIETRGLVAAVEAVDACLKAANVELMSYRFTTGGLVCIIVNGDVGAVRAAVDAGSTAAGKIGEVVGVHVIPRPAGDTMNIIEEIELAIENSGQDGTSLEEVRAEDFDTNEGCEDSIEESTIEESDDEAEQETEDDKEDENDDFYSEEDLNAAVVKLRELITGTKEESILREDKRLDKYGVRILRRVIRVLSVEDLDKSQISNMKKKELVDVIMDYIVKEEGTVRDDEG